MSMPAMVAGTTLTIVNQKHMKALKLGLVTALALGGLLACATLATAQDTKQEGKKGQGRAQMGQRMAEELNLTDEQKPKVQELMAAQRQKMQELRQDTSLTQEQRQEKMKAIRDDQDKKMKEILKPDQFEKWQKMREQMRPQRGKGGEKKEEGKKKE